MKRPYLLTFILYREFVVYNLIFTVAAVPWLIRFGQHSYVTIGWIKIIGFALAATFYWFFRKNRLLFFQNFRLSPWQLLGIALVIDGLQTYVILLIVHLLLP